MFGKHMLRFMIENMESISFFNISFADESIMPKPLLSSIKAGTTLMP
jgi:hypothetical protein